MKEMFLEDGREKIQEMDNQVSLLEKDKNDEFALTELYRIIHSYKGMVGTLELKSFEKFFHGLETFISVIQKKNYSISNKIIDLFWDLIDVIELGMDLFEQDKPLDKIMETNLKKIKKTQDSLNDDQSKTGEDSDRIQELLHQYGLDDLGSDSIDFGNDENKYYRIKITIEANIKLKLARLLVILKNLKGKGKILKFFPPLKDLLEEKFENDFEFLLSSNISLDEIKKAIEKSGEIESIDIDETDKDRIKFMMEEDELDDDIEMAENLIENTKTVDSVKVKLDLISKQVELFGELLISSKQLESIMERFHQTEGKEVIFQMQQYMVELQDIILKMQLVPIESVLRPFSRMVKSISRKQSKKINLKIKHNDVKVDRKILNHIGDIITHLVRNSINHGIEKGNERLKFNKTETANLLIETSIENNVLNLIIKDDGRGINSQEIAELAIEKELLTRNEINTMTEEEIIKIIFAPGFSSAKEINNISGRGMGLNIVKTKIESLNGTINFHTVVGEGTTFRVLLPLSKTLIRALLVKSGDQIYTIALDDIERLVQIRVDKIQKEGKKYYYSPNPQEKIEIFDLGRLFGLYSTSKLDEDSQIVKVVYVKKGDKYLGLVVDDFLKESEIVIKEIDDVMNISQGISGAAILEDGRVSLIIDPFTISS